MAGDWIKIEKITPEKPEILKMAMILKRNSDEIFGKIFKIWRWADDQSVDGTGMQITAKFLDRLAGKKGFAEAMRAVGWLSGEDGNLEFPGFLRHNGESAKARAETNRRVADHRAAKKAAGEGVTEKALQKPLPEKRREESNTPQPPFRGGSGGGDLLSKIKSLRPEWDVPMLADKEDRVFQKNRDLMGMFPEESWGVMREFLKKPLPEGDAYFQPVKLIEFLREPGGVMARAVAWKAKQRVPRFEVVEKGPQERTAEDAAALAEFLKKPEQRKAE